MKPKAFHPWSYQTWAAIELGKENYGEYLRLQARLAKISDKACLRLEWLIFYYTLGNRKIAPTARHFGISRRCLRKWSCRFDTRLVKSLVEHSRRPKHVRFWEVTHEQEAEVLMLRKQHMEFGKRKLRILYQKKYGKDISSWKIERVIRKHSLFTRKKRTYTATNHKQSRIRIHKVKEVLRKLPSGTLWHTDTIIIWWYGQRRVIFTALEEKTKLGFARVYTSNTSAHGADFLKRLAYLSNNKLRVIHSDNGSEFDKEFAKLCKELRIQQVFSRPHTPKDNPALEKFNHTIQREWLDYSVIGLDDINDANNDLTEWLVKYNSIRPHQALDYKTPLEYAFEHSSQLVPMSPAQSGY